jgi:hypothetical protein
MQGVSMFATSISLEVFLGALVALGYLGTPTAVIWGWARWIRRPKSRTVTSVLSFIGFVLATGSALLAVVMAAYAIVIHGFPFYDPLLMRICAAGFFLALGGIVFGVAGVWRPSSLRWHAPVSGVCMLAFWMIAMAGE